MTRPDPNRQDQDPFDLNDLLDEFDAAWATRSQPLIEDFLPRAPEALRPKLLEELVAIEWEYRAKFGQRFDVQEYVDRFPGASAIFENLAKLRNVQDGQPSGQSNTGNLRFQIQRIEFRGGIAEILLAWDRTLKREVAIKILQAQYVEDPDLRRRFRREAEIIAKLEHPGIIPIYAYGHFRNGEPYYAMRMVKDGQTLEDRLRPGEPKTPSGQTTIGPPRTPDAAARNRQVSEKTEVVTEQATAPTDSPPTETSKAGNSDAEPPPARSPIEIRLLLERFLTLTDTVKFAHSQGVLHRDIKPGNVILGPYGETFLIDWGFALDINAKAEPGEELSEYEKSFVSTADHRTGKAPKPFKGTPVYCSPEQALGRPSTESCDIYSLGATLYHMMTGKAPRRGTFESVMADARENRFVRPCEANPGLDQSLEAIILKSMHTRPQDRYVSAKDLGDDVRRWLADERVKAWTATEPWPLRIARFLRRKRKAALTSGAVVITPILAATLLRVPLFPVRQANPSAADAGRIHEWHDRYADLAEKAADLAESRPPGWTKKVDALFEDLDEMRGQFPAAHIPRTDRARIARKAFSDLIETPSSAVSQLKAMITGLARRPGKSQIALVDQVPPGQRTPGRVRLLDTGSGKTVWQGAIELQHTAERQDGISALSFSPDGEWLVAASRTGRGYLWKMPKSPVLAEESRPKLFWKIHDSATIERLLWADSTAHGLRLVALCDENSVSVWYWNSLEKAVGDFKEEAGLKPAMTRHFEGDVTDLLAPDSGKFGETLFAAIEGRLRVLDSKTLAEVGDLADSPVIGPSFRMAWHPSGSIVTAARNAISIVDPRTSKIVREIRDPRIDRAHHGGIESIEVTSDGLYAVTCSGDEMGRQLKVWNLDDPNDLIRFNLPGDPASPVGCKIHQDEPHSKSRRIWIWGAPSLIQADLIAPSIYERFPSDVVKILSIDISDEPNPRIGVLSPNHETDKLTLDIIDMANGGNRSRLHVKVPNSSDKAEVAITPQGDRVAVASDEHFVKIISGLDRGRTDPKVVEIPNSELRLIEWDAENRLFGLFGPGTEIRSLNITAGKPANRNVSKFSHHPAKLAGPGGNDTLESSRGTLFAAGTDGLVRSWNTKNPPGQGSVSRAWKTGPEPVFCLAVSDDARWVVCGDQRGTLDLVDTDSKSEMPVSSIVNAHADLVSSLAIARNDGPGNTGWILASGSRDGTSKLWSLRFGDAGATISPLTEMPPMSGPIRDLHFVRSQGLKLVVHTEGHFALHVWAIDEILDTLRAEESDVVARAQP